MTSSISSYSNQSNPISPLFQEGGAGSESNLILDLAKFQFNELSRTKEPFTHHFFSVTDAVSIMQFVSEWKQEANDLYTDIKAISAEWRPLSKRVLSMEWSQIDDVETVEYVLPLVSGDSTGDNPRARLLLSHDYEEGTVNAQIDFEDVGSFVAIQMKGLVLTLESLDKIQLSKRPSLEGESLSFQCNASNLRALRSFFQFYKELYEITFTNWGMAFPENCIFPRTWDKTLYPTFISSMMQVQDIPESGLIVESLYIAQELSRRCKTSCLDREKIAESVVEYALNDPKISVRELAFEIIFSSRNVELLESVAKKVWEQQDDSLTLLYIDRLCNLLSEQGNNALSIDLTNQLLVKTVEKFRNPEEVDQNLIWTAYSLGRRVASFLTQNLPVDIALAKEFAVLFEREWQHEYKPDFLDTLQGLAQTS